MWTVISRLEWATLLKRIYDVDALKCPRCDGRLEFIAALTDPVPIREILEQRAIGATPLPPSLGLSCSPGGSFVFRSRPPVVPAHPCPRPRPYRLRNTHLLQRAALTNPSLVQHQNPSAQKPRNRPSRTPVRASNAHSRPTLARRRTPTPHCAPYPFHSSEAPKANDVRALTMTVLRRVQRLLRRRGILDPKSEESDKASTLATPDIASAISCHPNRCRRGDTT